MKTYIIYCDESIKEGEFYSNFYGGALVSGAYFNDIVEKLNKYKEELNLTGEVKWSKVTSQYLSKYKEFMKYYFQLIKENKIKIRIMFKHNYKKTIGLTQEQKENEFYLLYYQFFKNAFGLQYCNNTNEEVNLIIYFDKLPETPERNETFKDFIYRLQFDNGFKERKIHIVKENITEVDSHKHVILQGMDVILGSIQFRLNDEHLRKDPVTGKRGKKTIAKEKLYKYINTLIREIYPNFNIGVSTSYKGDEKNKWFHPYRHWEFISSQYEIDVSKVKHR
ncbi:DUF3800 domain-containing protein [Thermoanaerobacterium thermosaccharolyticum]|jgi:hypothetical protein|uniref:DUF3800 domain-containing protein n=1 Tax=Thermoanaerobacterium thermosaccharolyticum TaxID=1517 RepID=UPI003D26AA49